MTRGIIKLNRGNRKITIFLSIAVFAKRWGVARKTIYALLKNGRFSPKNYIQISGQIFFWPDTKLKLIRKSKGFKKAISKQKEVRKNG